jgi:hypothetical protein
LEEIGRAQASLAIIELGAGVSIPTVRHLSESVAEDLRAVLIRINPRDAQTPRGHVGLPLNAAEGIHRICERL